MTPRDFCFWLQGRAELHPEPPSAAEWQSIKEHLALVFTKLTPPAPGEGNPPPAAPPFRRVVDQPKTFEDQYDWWRQYTPPPKPFMNPMDFRTQITC